MEAADGKNHLKAALTIMMLGRAMQEAEQGKLQNAVRLARSVILTYPDDETEIDSRQHQIEQQLFGSIDDLKKMQIVNLISELSAVRGVSDRELKLIDIANIGRNFTENEIAVAIISKILPEFEYSAHRLYERFKDHTSLRPQPNAAGLAFGGGDAPKEFIQLLLACMPVIQFVAGIGLGGFLPAFHSGRKSELQLKEITNQLQQREIQDEKWRQIVVQLKDAHALARETPNSEDIENLLADALYQLVSGQKKDED